MEKTPMQGLLDFYKENVEEGNKKGFAELYKTATKSLFKLINESLKERSPWKFEKLDINKFTFKDVKYQDGYFIFGVGDNKMCQFHIKEIPGWLFGIWWEDPVEKEISETKKCLEMKCDFFCQYESNIDKFKPSRSTLCKTPTVRVNENQEIDGYLGNVADMLVFMYTEPELAFCRDYCDWDYNIEYHTRAEAKKVFEKYIKQDEIEQRTTEELNERMLDKVRELFKEDFDNGTAIIYDNGEHVSPRYELVLNKDKYVEFEKATEGVYHLTDLYRADFCKKWSSEVTKCEKHAVKLGTWWYAPISMFVTLRDNKSFKTLLTKGGDK